MLREVCSGNVCVTTGQASAHSDLVGVVVFVVLLVVIGWVISRD